MVASPTFVNKSKQMTLASTPRMALSPDDFSPPLKRTEPSVPGYWTVDELAEELQVSRRYIHYLISGNPKRGVRIRLKAYNAGKSLLIADQDALHHIFDVRTSRSTSYNS